MRVLILLLAVFVPSQALAQANLTGQWLVTTDVYGNPLHQKLELKQEADKLSGALGRDKLEGTMTGTTLHFVAKDDEGNTSEVTATVACETFSGHIVNVDANDVAEREAFTFTASRVPPRRTGPPQRHEFIPTVFHRQFSPDIKPVLTVWPGDTIHTTTVDAAGRDEKGVARVLGGNPETGPFYVQTATPGDVLRVHFTRLRLNRDYAISDDAIVDRALSSELAAKMKDSGKAVRWKLDRERNVATPEKPGEHMKEFTVPLRPMLGCVAVAPGFASAPPPTGDSGRYGGNMDFNDVVEGATVYLPVNQPGALLYVGDGHAAQGDGELNGNALETSMEVEFTVDVISGKRLATPRVESDEQIMVVGLAGSLDDAIKIATNGMAQWLEEDYTLTPSEIAQVLGTSIEYSIGEVADRNASVIARLNKQRLATLSK